MTLFKKQIRAQQPSLNRNDGFTLLEALVTIGLTVIILSVFTAMLTAVHYISRNQFGIQATGFVQEGLDTLRSLNHDELLNRTDDRLLGLGFTRGDWEITGGSDKKLELTTTAADWAGETGLAILPGNYRNDFTYTAQVLVKNNTPIGWQTGLVFRYRDSENHYRFRFSAGNLAFELVQHGTVNTLWSQSSSFSKDSWYILEVVAAGENFTLKRNGITLAEVTDTVFSTGDLALASFNDALVQFDEVSVTGDGPGSWDFDNETNGQYPDDWRRFGPFDLPQGNAVLTITDYLGETNMKRAEIEVSWNEVGNTRNVIGSSIIVN